MTTSETFYHKNYWGRALVPCAMLLNFKFTFLRNPVETYLNDMYSFKLASTPRKDGQPLQGMTLQEKEV